MPSTPGTDARPPIGSGCCTSTNSREIFSAVGIPWCTRHNKAFLGRFFFGLFLLTGRFHKLVHFLSVDDVLHLESRKRVYQEDTTNNPEMLQT